MTQQATRQNDLDRVWDLIEKTGVGMLTTRFLGGLRSRSVELRPDRGSRSIRIVTDVRGLKDDEIETSPDVGPAFPCRRQSLSLDHRPRRGDA